MAGMRDYSDAEIDLVRKRSSGRYALRDRCYFDMALQIGLRVSEMLSLAVGQVYQYGMVVDEVSIERKHMKGGKAGKASGRTIPRWSVCSVAAFTHGRYPGADAKRGAGGAGVPRMAPPRAHPDSGGIDGSADGPNSRTLGHSADRS